MDLLTGIINTILGPDTSQMTEADRTKTEASRAKDRNAAGDAAFSASKNPGMAMMRPETSGFQSNTSLSDMISGIAKFLGGGGGG